MYCIRCGKENPDSAKFCNECGYDFRTLKKTVQTEPEAALRPTESVQPKAAVQEPEEPKKKKGWFGRFLVMLVIATAAYLITSGGAGELMDEIRPTPAPTMIVVPEPDSRYPTVIDGTADDEFLTCMELLEQERGTMETPVFIKFEWKALKMFKNAGFENADFGKLVGAYLQLVEAQQGLYQLDYHARITDVALHEQAQNQKYKIILFWIDYFGLLQQDPSAKVHYEKMIQAYEQSVLVNEDLTAQLIGVDFRWDEEAQNHYLTYFNHTDHTIGVDIHATYEYPDAYNGNGGYMFEDWTFNTIRPGEEVKFGFTKLDNQRDANVTLKWDLTQIVVDGEEVYGYYLQHK